MTNSATQSSTVLAKAVVGLAVPEDVDADPSDFGLVEPAGIEADGGLGERVVRTPGVARDEMIEDDPSRDELGRDPLEVGRCRGGR